VKEIKKVAIIAHGLGSSRGYSGEGKVYFEGIKTLEEHNLSYIIISFSKISSLDYRKIESKYVIPFKLRKFDKYQRLLVGRFRTPLRFLFVSIE
jgi:hypothetical protein